MAVPGQSSSMYLFAILTLTTAVIILVNFFSSDDVSFAVFYIWESIILASALLGLVYLVFTRTKRNHLENVCLRNESTKMNKTCVVRNVLLIAVCATGSGILPFYQAVQDVSCMTSAMDLTIYVSKFISLVLSGIFFLLEFIFFVCLRSYRCKSCVSRILVSIVLSANACMIINFVLNIIRASNTYIEESVRNTDKNSIQSWVFSHCENNSEKLDNDTSVAEHMFKYTNAFLLELGLLAFGVLGSMWNILGRVNVDGIINSVDNSAYLLDRENTDDEDDDDEEEDADEDLNIIQSGHYMFRITRSLKKTLTFVSGHALIFSLLLVLPVLGLHINSEVTKMMNDDTDVIIESDGSNQTLTSLEKGNYYLQTLYNYIVSIVPLVGYFMVRSIDVQNWRQNADTILLIVGGFGHLVLVLFETADSIVGFVSQSDRERLTEEIFFFVKILFHYIGIYYQIMLIMKARRFATVHVNRRLLHVIKGMIIFLGVCNTERWLVDSFLPPTNLRFVNDIKKEDAFGVKNWWFLTEILFPLVTFYRLISALLCFDVAQNFRRNGI